MNWAWNYVTFQRGTRLITGVTGSRMEDMQTDQSLSLAHREMPIEDQHHSASLLDLAAASAPNPP